MVESALELAEAESASTLVRVILMEVYAGGNGAEGIVYSIPSGINCSENNQDFVFTTLCASKVLYFTIVL